MSGDVEDRLVRMEKELDLFRECLKTLRPIVEEYYGRKELEGLVGYE